jgi:ATP-dependent DNA helicase RecQ
MPVLYLTLKQLSQRRILHFIPQKRTPYIRYMQRREQSEHLIFSRDIYEDLKQRYQERIEAILRYATTDNECRSRFMLRYFGEKNSHDCGQCDVCLANQNQLPSSGETTNAEELILQLLADRAKHPLTQLHDLPLPYPPIEAALCQLLNEEIIYHEDGCIYLK